MPLVINHILSPNIRQFLQPLFQTLINDTITNVQAERANRKSGKSKTPGKTNYWKVDWIRCTPLKSFDFEACEKFHLKTGARVLLRAYVDEINPKVIHVYKAVFNLRT